MIDARASTNERVRELLENGDLMYPSPSRLKRLWIANSQNPLDSLAIWPCGLLRLTGFRRDETGFRLKNCLV